MPEILGAVFDRVTLRGKIDRLWIKPWVVEPTKQQEFDKANAELYKQVDWAVDISQLDCKEIDIRAVPAKLIRRDPETQAIVTFEKVLEGKWQGLPFQFGAFEIQLELAAKYKFPGVVLIAPKRELKAKKCLADIEMLRREGIAELD